MKTLNWCPTMTGLLLLLASCADAPVDSAAPTELGPEPAAQAPAPVQRRLTAEQYRNAVVDLLGEGLILSGSLEPDTEVDGLFAVGAATASVSPRGVELYEAAAYTLAEQVMDTPDLRARLLPCEPTDVVDDDCAAQALEPLGQQAWRRPMQAEELDRLVTLAGLASSELGDFHDGLEFAVAAVLQSPHFLYRVELGEPDPERAGQLRYTDWEMASRLSFMLWNSLPDEELLLAAAAGELTTAAGVEAQTRRMLAEPRAREGVRTFFTEMLELHALDDLSKDPLVFTYMTDELGPSAREETLRVLEHLVFEEDGDYRDLITTQRTFLDRTLATLYNVRAPEREGFGEAWLEPEDGRRGLLGHASVLALQARPVSTSPTLRGMFVREVLLCQTVPPPPSDVDTSIPEPSGTARTMRERVAEHLEDDYCGSCHKQTDLVGLGLENFDGLGRYQSFDNGVPVDSSGVLDGQWFADSWELAGLLRDHERLGPCLVDTFYRYSVGHSVHDGEQPSVDWLADGFAASGYSMQELMVAVASSDAFRSVGEVTP